MIPEVASLLAGRHRLGFVGLCALIIRFMGVHRAQADLLMHARVRLARFILRFDRLALKWEQGRARPPRPCPRRAPRPKPETPPHRYPSEGWKDARIPNRSHWLCRIEQTLRQYAPAIEALIDDPDTIALCAAAPQTGRLLRPLCRMLGIDLPAHLRLPPRPARPKPAPKPRRRLPPVEPLPQHAETTFPFVPLRLRFKIPYRRRRSAAA